MKKKAKRRRRSNQMLSISPYLIAVAIAWVLAQGLKYVITSTRRRSFTSNLKQLYLSGNMPSAHSASVAALLTVVGAKDGVDSAIFALAALFSAIVMYDAFMVRRSSGEQGEAVRALVKASSAKIKQPMVAKGHTPIEVLAGAGLGVLVGAIVATI